MKQLNEIAFFSDDVKGMTAFYQSLLGVNPVAQSEGMSIFMVGATKIFIHRNYDPAEGELPPENHMAFAVEDLDAACHDLQKAGVALEVEPRVYYWGRSAYLGDPDGHLMELAQMEKDSDAA